MRIAGLYLRSQRRLQMSITSFVLAKFLEAPTRADGINVPLGKNGTEPGLQGAAPMEVTEEHTSELQSHLNIVCRLLLEKKKITGFRGACFAAKNRGRRGAQERSLF